MSDTAQRLRQLREIMAKQNIQALFLSTFDEYLSEYVPERNQRLNWLTGFTGSTGAAVILENKAAMFVDGRYTVQVRQQVDSDSFEFKHLIDDPFADWIVEQLAAGQRVGIDSRMISLDGFHKLKGQLDKHNIELIELSSHPVDEIWQDRPEDVVKQGRLLSMQYTGESSTEKRKRIADQLKKNQQDAALIFAPDSVAWLLNVRGQDIPATPVILGYAIIHSDMRVDWFTNPSKVPEGIDDHVGGNLNVVPEADAAQALGSLEGQVVLADPATANAWTQLTLERAGAKLVAGQDPVLLPKAAKNATEQEGMRQAHIRDGVAEVKFLHWLDSSLQAGETFDEAQLSDKLLSFRQQQDKFQEVSFSTISAAGSNAAMCHYNHNNGTPAKLPENGVYLVDSGGQYLDGTTDITRTVAIGEPSSEIRRQFTRVLKGYIALDTARFPQGTTGTQLDVLARQFLWRYGYDYDHGTGHGVGTFLGVHEGPQRISKALNSTALEPGMVVSNEPGYYKADAYGIRCENLVMVREAKDLGGDIPMLEFETLTLAPFDLRLVDKEIMTTAEIEWLNGYHKRVRETLSPMLSESEQAWLEQVTRAI